MARLGNVWHLPSNPEPPGRSGMRDPVFPATPVETVTIWTGNQWAGGGNAGNQLQDGSTLFFRQVGDTAWTAVPLQWGVTLGNNKYYSAAIPAATLAAGTGIQYYLRIAYDDHDTTFLQLNADGVTSQTTSDEGAAQAAPFGFTVETAAERGQWDPVFGLPNVGIHAHVLLTGQVLMWGRRDQADQSLDVDPPGPLQPGAPPAPPAQCTPFLWNPADGRITTTWQPTLADNSGRANLFCSSHSFLADGRLLVAGGHLADGAGLNQTIIYDPVKNTWTPSAVMTNGRWYPTLTTLDDGSVLILAGSYRKDDMSIVQNTVPEVWKDGVLTSIADKMLDYYPRVHVASSSLVWTTGSLQQTFTLDVTSGGGWTAVPGAVRDKALRDYAPSVLYDTDKAIYIGGGSPPTAAAELIDFNESPPGWTPTAAMNFPRRQHNATILADGTVLVTGGARSGGSGPPENFNNLDPGQPVHIAELWDPATGRWTELAAETVDRCYHSTAVLLPDGRVLSAGGGEFHPVEGVQQQNNPADSHRDAQLFSPPYLFKGGRPVITNAPDTTRLADTFHVETAQAADISKVTLIRLSSATHSFNTGQRCSMLAFKVAGDGLDVTSPKVCPPGHYLLFLVNRAGVPSVAKIIQVTAGVPAGPTPAVEAAAAAPHAAAPMDALALQEAVHAAAAGTKVVVGLTGTCPYGISACWGGAHEALRQLDGVQLVDPIPDGERSTATVFLVDDRLPAVDRWQPEFHAIVNDSYQLRGVEVTVSAPVVRRDDRLFLVGDAGRPDVELVPLDASDKVQWDRAARTPLPAGAEEADAYDRLAGEVAVAGGQVTATVTGPLKTSDTGQRVEVREFAPAGP